MNAMGHDVPNIHGVDQKAGKGPSGNLEMGDTFTVLKVRDNNASAGQACPGMNAAGECLGRK